MPHDWKYQGYSDVHECVNCGTRMRGWRNADPKAVARIVYNKHYPDLVGSMSQNDFYKTYSCEELVALIVQRT
jgi:hypothetical protein